MDNSSDFNSLREDIITAVFNVFDQISFIEESEDIKDFVEEKTDEINQNLTEVKQQLKQFADNDYTLQDVESDIAKLRLVLNDLSASSSNEGINEISDNINRIVSSVENLQTSLTQEQMFELKDNFEKLNEDIVSLSTRTNKLLLNSDESANTLNDFSNLISQLEERINYLDSKEITERIEDKLDRTMTVISENNASSNVMRQALIYIGEWIDTTSEKIDSLCEQANEFDNIKESLERLQDGMPKDIVEFLTDKFEEQQERMDRLEMKLEKLLSAVDNIDDTKLIKKVEKLDKQLTKVSTNIEKLTSYVDE